MFTLRALLGGPRLAEEDNMRARLVMVVGLVVVGCGGAVEAQNSGADLAPFIGAAGAPGDRQGVGAAGEPTDTGEGGHRMPPDLPPAWCLFACRTTVRTLEATGYSVVASTSFARSSGACGSPSIDECKPGVASIVHTQCVPGDAPPPETPGCPPESMVGSSGM